MTIATYPSIELSLSSLKIETARTAAPRSRAVWDRVIAIRRILAGNIAPGVARSSTYPDG
jgi:hypothetical protein